MISSSHFFQTEVFLTSEILVRNYNWQHTISASTVNLVHSGYMISQEETVGKSSQGVPALHMLHAPCKPVCFIVSFGIPCNRGSSKGRVGRWSKHPQVLLALNSLKLKTHSPKQADSWNADFSSLSWCSQPSYLIIFPLLMYARTISTIKSLNWYKVKK